MKPSDILLIRERLGLTQIELAQLVGVHPLTVSKWERGLLSVPAYQQMLLVACSRAGERGLTNLSKALELSPVFALYRVLTCLFG